MAEEKKQPKDNWDKLETAAKVVSLIAIPVLVGFGGFWIEQSIKEADNRVKSVEIAIDVLRSPPGDSLTPGLREWAVNVLDNSSEIPLSEQARRELLQRPLPPLHPSQERSGVAGHGMYGFGNPNELPDGTPFTVIGVEGREAQIELDDEIVTLRIGDTYAPLGSDCVLYFLGSNSEDGFAIIATVCEEGKI